MELCERSELEVLRSELASSERSEGLEDQSLRAEARWRDVHAEALELRAQRQEAQELTETCRAELARGRPAVVVPGELADWLRVEFDREALALWEAFQRLRPGGKLFEAPSYVVGAEVERQRASEGQRRLRTQEGRPIRGEFRGVFSTAAAEEKQRKASASFLKSCQALAAKSSKLLASKVDEDASLGSTTCIL